jgi:hypothetical protein
MLDGALVPAGNGYASNGSPEPGAFLVTNQADLEEFRLELKVSSDLGKRRQAKSLAADAICCPVVADLCGT